MTGELLVHIATQPYEPEFRRGIRVVGNIYAATEGNPSQRQVMIPLGWDVQPASFILPPGRYVVEATLPSGEVLSDDVEVAEGESAAVAFDATASPYESHSWQYVVGNIEAADVYHGRASYPLPNSHRSQSFARRSLEGPPSARTEGDAHEVAWLPALSPRGLPFPALNRLGRLPSRSAIGNVSALLGLTMPPVSVLPTTGDKRAPLFRFAGQLPPGVPAGRPAPQYLLASSAGDAYLVTLPSPWRDSGGQYAVVEVLLNLRQSPTGSPVSVAVRDPSVGAGLGYMATGALDKAALMFSDVRELLLRKVDNPVAAAAAGYLLIGTETTSEPQEWDRWLDNLRRYFPYLSDGAILHGIRRLRTARDESDVDQAREALLEGYERGLPVFTLGLTWLIDGLSAFASDPKCSAAMQQVRHLCWRVDMREPFVVLHLGEPEP